jgi:hypothetical protein
MSGRYEFHGKGKDLYEAVRKAHEFVPKGFVKCLTKIGRGFSAIFLY